MSSDGKSNRALSQPKLCMQNRVLGPIRFFVNRSNSSRHHTVYWLNSILTNSISNTEK